ncbi:hypothetical protein SAMN05444166_1639 [Singulisphaera sp. GP187]|nr:hypothetical protein SAMN05444166_1639 [Singulisphaera sp. GP187]
MTSRTLWRLTPLSAGMVFRAIFSVRFSSGEAWSCELGGLCVVWRRRPFGQPDCVVVHYPSG